MKVYACVKKGLHHRDGLCEDTALLNHIVINSGEMCLDLPEDFLIGVADGVGGASAGEVASGLTMSGLAQCSAERAGKEEVKARLCELNRLIRRIGKEVDACAGMASTFAGFGKKGADAYVIWAGNSRVYQIVGEDGAGSVQKLTVDHNEKNDWLESGRINSLKEAAGGEALTGYMGMSAEGFRQKLETVEVFLPGTKRFFLTTDGIHDHIPEMRLKELLLSGKPGGELLREMIQAALECGSRDDMSIVLLEYESDESRGGQSGEKGEQK